MQYNQTDPSKHKNTQKKRRMW